MTTDTNDMDVHLLMRQLIEQTSMKALGWILDQHCELRWSGQELLVIFRGNHRMARELLFEEDTRQTLQTILQTLQPGPYTVRIVEDFASVATEDALRAAAATCTACRLRSGRTQVVFGVGDPHAALMLIGEVPGRDEDLQGEPLIGRAGTVLTSLLAEIGLTRPDVYITSIVKCRPPNNRTPEPDERDRCEPWLRRQIELVHPHVIVTLGTFPTQTLLGSQQPLSSLRGRFHDYRGIKVMPTFHPAFLLRNPERKEEALVDLTHVQVELAGLLVTRPSPVDGALDDDALVCEARERIAHYAMVRPTLQDLAAHYVTMESLSQEEVALRTRINHLRREGQRLGAHLQQIGLTLEQSSTAMENRGELADDSHDHLDG